MVGEALLVFGDDVLDVRPQFFARVEDERRGVIEIVSHVWQLRKPGKLVLSSPAPTLKVPGLARVWQMIVVR